MNINQVEAVQRAAKLLGSQRALAVALGVAPVNVSQWVNPTTAKGRPVPPKQCVRIEALTDGTVTRRDLRPDDWQAIWPELADSQEKQAPALTQQAPAAINSEALQQAKGVA